MALPPSVHDLFDYQHWVVEELERSGGRLVDECLHTDFVEPDGGTLTLDVDSHRLEFEDGTFLDFEFAVNEDLELLTYSFHFQSEGGELYWRKDKHPGHEHERGMDGREEHLHIPHRADPEYRFPFETVDLAEVIDEIHQHRDGVQLTPRTVAQVAAALRATPLQRD